MTIDPLYERYLIQYQIRLKSKMISVTENAIADLSAYLARYAKKFPDDFATRITYINRMGIKTELQNQIDQLSRDIAYLTRKGVEDSWELSVEKNNLITREYVAGMTLKAGLTTTLFGNNQGALVSYLENRSNISERVLNYTGVFQEQIENYLSSGIIQGKSAREIARELTKIASDPMAEFKTLSKAFPEAELSLGTPGSGVYQSVYANFMRIARTETNIAYRLSNYEKRKDAPHVVGMEVHLSDAHDIVDICDAMEGSYPVEFVFCGWHPNCLCYEVDILADKDEFREWLRDGGEGDLNSRNEVDRIPLSAERYVLTHQDKFQNAYFYRDNFVNGQPMPIVGGARKDLQPYQLLPKEGNTREIERIIRNSFASK